MTEADFWNRLAWRMCREFSGVPKVDVRHLWCDGLLPEQYSLAAPSPCIRGKAWICSDTQELWEFTLALKSAVGSTSDIDWASLIPAESATYWLAIDTRRKRIQIELPVASPAQ